MWPVDIRVSWIDGSTVLRLYSGERLLACPSLVGVHRSFEDGPAGKVSRRRRPCWLDGIFLQLVISPLGSSFCRHVEMFTLSLALRPPVLSIARLTDRGAVLGFLGLYAQHMPPKAPEVSAACSATAIC